MPAHESVQPKTLADDLRSRSDADVAAVLRTRPDLLNPIPSDMRALTTRAATSPSIARYLDTVDCIHHYALRVASEQSIAGSTSADRIIEAVVSDIGDPSVRGTVVQAVDNLRTAAVLWGSPERTNVVTAVRDQVAAAPVPSWPAPACTGDHVDASLADAIAHRGASASATILTSVEEIADVWSLEPGAVLRSGGLSARSLDALAERLGIGSPQAAFAIDVAASAGLIAQGAAETDIGWMPTAAFDTWSGQPAPRRWTTLARAWLDRSSITGTRALTDNDHPFTIPWREHLLSVTGEATRTCTVESLVAVIDFRWPRRRGAKRTAALESLWLEATALGVLVDGVLTPAGRALATGANNAAIAKALAGYLPAEVPSVHVQADHTIVAPGPLAPPVARQLRALADVESRGHGTVFRITPTSLQRALSLDPDPQGWIDFLATISDSPLPQPIRYLVTDSARGIVKARHRYQAPAAPAPLRRPRSVASPSRVDKALDVLRDRTRRDTQALAPESIEIPKMESAAVVASLKYAIDHHETVHMSHAESDGSTAALLVDPIRLGGGSLTAYDHAGEQVRTFAVSRISGVVAVRISA